MVQTIAYAAPTFFSSRYKEFYCLLLTMVMMAMWMSRCLQRQRHHHRNAAAGWQHGNKRTTSHLRIAKFSNKKIAKRIEKKKHCNGIQVKSMWKIIAYIAMHLAQIFQADFSFFF